MEPPPTAGELIRQRRQQLGWTQKHLAELLRVSEQTVIRWEKGRHPPSRHAARVEQVLGISFRAPPAGRAAAQELTDQEREEMLEEFLRLGRLLWGDDAPQRAEPEDKPPEHRRLNA